MADEAPAARAQGESDADLLAAAGGPHEQEVGDVGARDQEYEADHAEEQAGHREQRAALLGVALADRRDRGGLLPVRVRVGRGQLPGERGYSGLRLLGGHAVFEPPDHVEPARAALREQVRVHLAGVAGARRAHERLHRHRHVDVVRRPRLRSVEARRRDAHYRERLAVQQQLPSGDLRVAREAALPQRVTDDRDRVPAGRRVLLRQEGAPARRAHPERVEVVARDDQAGDHVGLVVALQAQRDR